MSPEPNDLKWLRISDFTAGIYDHSTISNANALVPAPNGAASADNTYACIALAGGGIGPMPGVVNTYQWPMTANPNGATYIVGLLVHGQLHDPVTEAFVVGEYDNAPGGSTGHQVGAGSLTLETDTWNLAVNTATPTAAGIFGAPYPRMTRMAESAPTTTPGNPVIVFPTAPEGPPGHLYVYPDPAAPTVYGVLDLVSGSDITGQVYVHQSRVVVTAGINYPFPAGGGFDTNEQICYTDPPNSVTYGFQRTVFDAEEPYGYGCGGTQSAGELFLVKQRGGGIVVTGDVVSPSVTHLSGVQPTGEVVGRAASGPEGFFYCSVANGAWIWNGGNVSSKISQQLDDNFYVTPDESTMPSNNYAFFVESIGDKMYFSNNWCYNAATGSWWRYYPTELQNTAGQTFWWTNYVNGRWSYCAPLSLPASKTFLWRFDAQAPSTFWSWRSLPIRVSEDRLVNAREVLVRASNPFGNAASTLRIRVLNNGSEVGQVTTLAGANDSIGAVPQTIRIPIGGQSGAGVQPYPTGDLTVDIYADGHGGGAPIIHFIDIGYRERQHLPTVGLAS